MMLIAIFFLLLQAAPPRSSEKPVLDQIADSGRCAGLAESPDARVNPQPAIAPGPPPLLSFRYYEGKSHGRNGNQDLLLDDAGH